MCTYTYLITNKHIFNKHKHLHTYYKCMLSKSMRKCHATISAPTVSRMHIITNIHTHAYTCGIVPLQSTIKRARRYQYRQLLQRWQSQQQQQQRQRWRGHIHKYGETSPQNQFIRWLSNAALRTHTNRGKGKRTHSHTHTHSSYSIPMFVAVFEWLTTFRINICAHLRAYIPTYVGCECVYTRVALPIEHIIVLPSSSALASSTLTIVFLSKAWLYWLTYNVALLCTFTWMCVCARAFLWAWRCSSLLSLAN